MSRAYREALKVNKDLDVREFTKQPGKKDKKGKPIYFTQQSNKDECDINNIVQRYTVAGMIQSVSNFEHRFGDVTGIDFKTAMDLVVGSQQQFDELPSNIRDRFDNNPEKLLKFMENPNNREEAIKFGLINRDWTDATDGLGEHIADESQRKSKAEPLDAIPPPADRPEPEPKSPVG